MPKRSLAGDDATKEGFTGHELDAETGLNYAGARYYDPEIGRWLAVDPHAVSYPGLAPYSYVANSPLVLVDPDGRDILIHYEDENGKTRRWRFTGSNDADAPDNSFVRDFLIAYHYNINNGGGESMHAIAHDRDALVSLSKGERNTHHIGRVTWNPSQGLDVGDGSILSPATLAEHEFAHALSFVTNSDAHVARRRTRGPAGFRNAEEYRVIMGPERRTAIANGENPRNKDDAEEAHRVITEGPTSTTVNRLRTYNYYQRNFSGYNVDWIFERYYVRIPSILW